eukprot:gene261-427_t
MAYLRYYSRAWWRPRRRTKRKLQEAPREFCRIATLNLQKAGKISGKDAKIMDAVDFQKTNRIDMLFVQELGEPKTEVRTTMLKWGYRLVACGKVGIIMSPAMHWRKEDQFKSGDRCVGVVVGGCAYCSLYQPYDDHTEAGRQELEVFFEEREELMAKISKRKIWRKVLGGDWNAAIAALDDDLANEHPGVVGGWTLRTELGWAFRENVGFAHSRYLVVADSHKRVPGRGTWHPQTGPRGNWRELDYFFVSKDMLKDVGRIKCVPTAVLTDHRAKTMEIRWRETKKAKAVRRRAAEERAAERKKKVETRTIHRRKELQTAYGVAVQGATTAAIAEKGLEGPAPASAAEAAEHHRGRWEVASEALYREGMEVLGPVTASKTGEWVTMAETAQHQTELAGLLEERRGMTGATAEERRQCQARINECRERWKSRKKELYAAWLNEQAELAVAAVQRGDTAKAYELMGNMNDMKPEDAGNSQVDFEIGDLKEHFEKIGNKPFDPPLGFLAEVDQVLGQKPVKTALGDTPTNEEILKHLWKRVKPGAATGNDRVQVQMLKYGGAAAQECFCDLVRWVWRRPRDQPKQWYIVKLVILWKLKAPREDMDNYRAITLINLGSKVVEGIAQQRIYNHLEHEVGFFGQEQSGFRAGRSTDDLALAVRLIMEHGAISGRLEILLRIALLLVDIKKAFPSAVREIAYHVLRRCGCDDRLMAVFESVHEDSEFYVHYRGKDSALFKNIRGFREGGSSSGLGFEVVIEIVVMLINQECAGLEFQDDDDFATPLNRRARTMAGADRVGCQLFADDTTLIQLLGALEANEAKVAEIVGRARMEIHPGKTERMVARKKGGEVLEHPDRPEPHDAGDPTKKFLQQQAKLVGGYVEDDGSLDREHSFRLEKARKQFGKWRWILEQMDEKRRNGGLEAWRTGNILCANVVSALVYNPMRPFWIKQQREYQVFLNRVVRFAAGWTLKELQENEGVNMADLRTLVGIPHIQVLIERRQLAYFGRMMRSQKNTLVKKLLFGRMGSATASPPTARYIHDLMVRAVGADYLTVVHDEEEYATRTEAYLWDLEGERDWWASVAGGAWKSGKSVRYRRDTQARDWEAFEEQLDRFEDGNPDGLDARVFECDDCKIRLLVVNGDGTSEQAVRTHKRDCRANFVAAEFIPSRMRKIKRYWECRTCGHRCLKQGDMYRHAQWHQQAGDP